MASILSNSAYQATLSSGTSTARSSSRCLAANAHNWGAGPGILWNASWMFVKYPSTRRVLFTLIVSFISSLMQISTADVYLFFPALGCPTVHALKWIRLQHVSSCIFVQSTPDQELDIQKIHHLNHLIQIFPSSLGVLQSHHDENYDFSLLFFLPLPEQGLHYGF